MSVERRRFDQLQDPARCSVHHRHLPAGLVRRRRRPQGHLAVRYFPGAEPDHQLRDRPGDRDLRLRHLGGLGYLDSARDRGLRRVLRPAHRTDDGGASQIPFVVRDDASTSKVLFKTSDATWQAYNTYGGADFYQGPANGRAYKISYNRPFATRGSAKRPRLPVQQRVPDDPLPGAQRVRHELHHRRGRRPARQPDREPQGVPVRRPRRVLVRAPSAPPSKRPGTPAPASRSSAATRCTGRPAGRTARTAHNTDHRTLVCYKETWDNAKSDPSSGVDRHLARPAVQPAGQRRPAGERADRHHVHEQQRRPGHPGAGCPGQVPALAGHHRRHPRRPARPPRSPRTPSATSPTRTWTTASGPPG